MTNFDLINTEIQLNALKEADRVGLIVEYKTLDRNYGRIAVFWLDPIFMYYMGEEL